MNEEKRELISVILVALAVIIPTSMFLWVTAKDYNELQKLDKQIEIEKNKTKQIKYEANIEKLRDINNMWEYHLERIARDLCKREDDLTLECYTNSIRELKDSFTD